MVSMSSQVPGLTTREVPVANPSDAPHEVSEAAARLDEELRKSHPATITGEQAAGPPPDEYYDPNQTFVEYRKSASNGTAYLLIFMLVVTLCLITWAIKSDKGVDLSALMNAAASRGSATDAPPDEDPEPEASPEESEASEDSEDSEGEPESRSPEDTADDEAGAPADKEPEPEPSPQAEPAKEPKTEAKPPTKRPAKTKTAKSSTGAKLKGDAAFERGDYGNAIKQYEKVLESNSKDNRSATRLGWSYIEQGDNSGAVKAFRTALGSNASAAEPHYGLGLAYQSLGRADAAKEEYEEYLRLKPDGRDAAEVRAMLRSLE